MEHVLMIGGGRIGTALAHVLREKGTVDVWDVDPARMAKPVRLEEVLPKATYIFLCVPSTALRTVVKQIAEQNASAPVIALEKGLEAESGKTTDAVLAEVLGPNRAFALLGGPLLAEELLKDQPGVGVCASTDAALRQNMHALFAGTNVRMEMEADVRGVALAGVLKNVYSVGLGIADGLGWGCNARGWLTARSLGELACLLAELGGTEKAAYGSAGAGDFLATSMSTDSRNHKTGVEIATTGAIGTPSEGTRSMPSLRALLNNNTGGWPILHAVDRAISGEPAADVFKNLLTMES